MCVFKAIIRVPTCTFCEADITVQRAGTTPGSLTYSLSSCVACNNSKLVLLIKVIHYLLRGEQGTDAGLIQAEVVTTAHALSSLRLNISSL